MIDIVRVRNKLTGHQYNWPRSLAERDRNIEIIDRPTLDDHGNQIPPKSKEPQRPSPTPAPTGDTTTTDDSPKELA